MDVEQNHTEIIETFLGSTQVFSRALINIVEEEALHEATQAPLTPTQVTALKLVAQADAKTLGDLAALLGVSNAAASKLVDRLVRRDLLMRRQGRLDRREMSLSLTTSGHDLLARYEALKTVMLTRTFEEFSPEELRRAAGLLTKLSTIILRQSRRPEEPCLQCYMYARQGCVARGVRRDGCRNLRRLRQSGGVKQAQ